VSLSADRTGKSVAFLKGLKGKLKITLNDSEGGELIIITSQFLTVVTHEREKPSEIKLAGVL